ncbi:MAG: glutathione-disulfide reductase [Magnetovibrionaceae bacterium]
MTTYDYDLITLGAGSGGVRASRISGTHGARVAIVEESRPGGTCVMRGCVPKKLLVYGAHYAHHIEDAAGFGWTIEGANHDWPALIASKDKELDRLEGIYRRLLKNAEVDLIEGRGKLIDAHTVEVAGKTYTAEKILIAVGGWPSMPNIPGIEHVITSNEALDLPELPKRIVIVGGGYIAVEFAGIFNAFGSEVTLVIRGDNILRGFDSTMREGLANEMRKQGIEILADCQVESIEKLPSGFDVMLDNTDCLKVDAVMYATGRLPNTKNLGLEEVGVKMNDKGAVIVDEWNQSSIENIYAVGDVTDRVALTPVAIAEGHAFADTTFGNKPRTVNYDDIPSAVFSQPAIGTVGLTEEEARRRGKVDVYLSKFRAMKHTLSGRDEFIGIKLLVDPETDKVLGCHMLGDDGPELAQGLGIAIKAGATKADFDATIGIHPTAAEEFVTLREKLPDHDKCND